MNSLLRGLCIGTAGSLAAASAVGPDYHRPPFAATDVYKESADWKPSEPNDVLSRGPWWKIFHDDALDALEVQIDISNQNVKAAEAAFEQSRALVAQARAGFWPTIAATLGVQRQNAPTVVTKWKVQCVWDAGTDGYTAFQKFCANVKELSEGRLELEAHSAGQLVGSFDMFDAVKAGTVNFRALARAAASVLTAAGTTP